MAEQVQEILDDMVAPLADLQKRGIFSEDEITSIVARRRESEYRMRRLNPRQSDYVEYLHMEEKLENLRRLRTKRIYAKDSNKSNVKHTNQKFIGDTHGIRFLHLLWIRTLRKFRTVEMYLQYAEFCNRVSSFQQLSKAYQQALSFFPDSVDIWIGAASHEYFGQQSMRAARILLQRALRIHSGEAELWIQYFRLELHWRCKLMGRKLILQEGEKESKETEESKEADEEAKKQKDPYAMAKLVYQEAIKSKAATPELPWQFVTACQDFPVKEMQEWIVEGLSHANENAWIIHAKYLASLKSDESVSETEPPQKKQRTQDPVVVLLKDACASLPTSKMFLQAIQCLDEYAEEQDDDTAIRAFQTKLFADATQQELMNDELLTLQIGHLPPMDAISLLKEHTNTIGGSLWIKYASLVLKVEGQKPAVKTLETALSKISMDKPVYIVALVQLLGIQLASEDYSEDVSSKLVHRLLLLAPANPMAVCDEPIHENSRHVPAVLDAYLEHLLLSGKPKPSGAVAAILASSCINEWVVHAPECVDSIMDRILKLEECQKKQAVLYKRAIEIFRDTANEDKYRLRRDNELRYRVSGIRPSFRIPVVSDAGDNFERIVEDYYKRFQVCVVRRVGNIGKDTEFGWKDIGSLYANLEGKDKESWCIENGGERTSSESLSPVGMLSPNNTSKALRAYCSFLVQNDNTSYERTLKILPFECFDDLPWIYETALWVFFGRNPRGNLPLQGRAEHTDSVYHDGTWHYQLSGRKKWFLRPTKELLQKASASFGNRDVFEIECNQGDLILLNTRLWFHRTEVPAQAEPSVSYARDFRYADSGATEPVMSATMTNVDGVYATDDICAGTILFTEETMPDCELHRSSTNPNCELVELESGLQAIVASCEIKAGDFFCIAESEDESCIAESEDENSSASDGFYGED